MSGCCSGGRRVLVEVECLSIADETCDRCADTASSARAGVAAASSALAGANVIVDLVERPLAPGDLERSNRVLVNGRTVEEWLGGSRQESACPSCSEMLGRDVCCGESVLNGVSTQSLAEDAVVDAIMLAAGFGTMARVVREAARESSDPPADS